MNEDKRMECEVRGLQMVTLPAVSLYHQPRDVKRGREKDSMEGKKRKRWVIPFASLSRQWVVAEASFTATAESRRCPIHIPCEKPVSL
ncbi:unnamed protein product [Hymenolepis diminuta]|uniref:Uncharacterized protein n=1 Tax=Hymenolepis diminuta TaxID=6216 RepID=A0A0R3STF4_HYMDI|nr:unnamed protein product [Hymenolepis diminuta]